MSVTSVKRCNRGSDKSITKSSRNEIRIILVGNEAKVSFDRYKDVTSQLESQKYRTIFSLLLKRMGTILKTINSNLHINPGAFRLYCQVTTILITNYLKFVRISPTLYKVCRYHTLFYSMKETLPYIYVKLASTKNEIK